MKPTRVYIVYSVYCNEETFEKAFFNELEAEEHASWCEEEYDSRHFVKSMRVY
jgi:hypothetical protein